MGSGKIRGGGGQEGNTEEVGEDGLNKKYRGEEQICKCAGNQL